MRRYAIEAALFQLPIPLGRFSHNFWVLKDAVTDKVVAQLHGLATSRSTGRILPMGFTKNHSLRAHHFVYEAGLFPDEQISGTFYLPVMADQTIVVGEGVLDLWRSAVALLPQINQLNLDYPSCGFKLPLITTINSNSIYHTFARIMNVCPYTFERYRQIGIENSIIHLVK